MQGLRRHVTALTTDQLGLVTRDQLSDAGISRGQRSRLVRDGTLVAVGARTFVLSGLGPDPRRGVLAACLEVGGIASHGSAAWLHGLPGFGPGTPPEIIVPRGRRAPTSEIGIVHSTTWLPVDDQTSARGVPCTSVARTLLGLAGQAPALDADRVEAAVEDAIRLGKAREPWLWSRLEKLRCRGRSGVVLLETILQRRASGERTESWLEREFLRIVHQAGLPVPICQARIEASGAFVARVDFLYEELGIVVEVAGAIAHASREQRASDARRRNELGMLGLLVLEFTYEQVVREPDRVVAEVRRAIAARRHALAG